MSPKGSADPVLVPRWVAKLALQALIPQRELARLRARADKRYAAEVLRLETACDALKAALGA